MFGKDEKDTLSKLTTLNNSEIALLSTCDIKLTVIQGALLEIAKCLSGPGSQPVTPVTGAFVTSGVVEEKVPSPSKGEKTGPSTSSPLSDKDFVSKADKDQSLPSNFDVSTAGTSSKTVQEQVQNPATTEGEETTPVTQRKPRKLLASEESEEEEELIQTPKTDKGKGIMETDEEEMAKQQKFEQDKALAKEWKISLEELYAQREQMKLAEEARANEEATAKLVHAIAKEEVKGSKLPPLQTQRHVLSKFEEEKEKKTALAYSTQAKFDAAARRKFADVSTRRLMKEKIVKAMPYQKKNQQWKLTITREGSITEPGYEAGEIASMGISEWIELASVLANTKSEAGMKIKEFLKNLMDKVIALNLVPQDILEGAAVTSPKIKSRKKLEKKESEMEVIAKLIQEGIYPGITPTADLSLPSGTQPVDGRWIESPEPGIFFRDPLSNQMCFQRLNQLHLVDTKQLLAYKFMIGARNDLAAFKAAINDELRRRPEDLQDPKLFYVKQELVDEDFTREQFLKQEKDVQIGMIKALEEEEEEG